MKKLICILLLIALMPLPVWADWLKLEEGLHYQLMKTAKSQTAQFHVLKIDTHRFTLKPILSPTLTSAKAMRESSKAIAVINANFFDTSDKALGLVISDGQTRNPFKSISWWGVLCMNRKGQAAIIHSSNYNKGLCWNALQAGPRLLIDGNVPKLKPNYSKKSVVAIGDKGEVYIIASDQAVNINDLVEFLRSPVKTGGLSVKNALNLDGGGSTQLSIATKNLQIEKRGFSTIPVGLGVFAKGR